MNKDLLLSDLMDEIRRHDYYKDHLIKRLEKDKIDLNEYENLVSFERRELKLIISDILDKHIFNGSGEHFCSPDLNGICMICDEKIIHTHQYK
jgi:predicted metal-binding protein